MHKTFSTLVIILAVSAFMLYWSYFETGQILKPVVSSEISYYPNTQSAISPIPQEIELDGNKIKLGESLFMDPRLSGDNSLSCHDCHNLNKGGVDRLQQSPGIYGKTAPLNTPTVFNVAFNFKFLWSGKFNSLEEQLNGLIKHSPLLGTNWEEIITKLKADSSYIQAFDKIYSDGITIENIQDVLSIFQQSLYTPNSNFDNYLRGDESAISDLEKQGFSLFQSYGCISCHQGVNIGGNLYQKFGILKDYYRSAEVAALPAAYLGRYNITGDEKDRFVYRVPSLRNVFLTPPYFHDGSATTLEDAVKIMAEYQLGISLRNDETRKIVAFLKTLSGEYKGKPLADSRDNK